MKNLSVLLGGGGVDYGADLCDGVCREAALGGVFADGGFVRGDVDAVDLVVCDVALEPLDLRAEGAEDAAGGLRDGLQLFRGELAGVGDFAFDNVLRHALWPFVSVFGPRGERGLLGEVRIHGSCWIGWGISWLVLAPGVVVKLALLTANSRFP